MRYGLVLNKEHKFVYAVRHGHVRWLPYKIQKRIVHIWNPIACRIWGHDWMPSHSDHISKMETQPDGNTIEHYDIEGCTACSKQQPVRPEWEMLHWIFDGESKETGGKYYHLVEDLALRNDKI